MLERWIADRPFREAHPPGQSDLDIARGTHAREILQDHWRNWIVESDWAWLAETGINTVRIPVGLITVVDPIPAPGWQFRLHFSASVHSPFSCVLRSLTGCRVLRGFPPFALNESPLAFLSCSCLFSTHSSHLGQGKHNGP